MSQLTQYIKQGSVYGAQVEVGTNWITGNDGLSMVYVYQGPVCYTRNTIILIVNFVCSVFFFMNLEQKKILKSNAKCVDYNVINLAAIKT